MEAQPKKKVNRAKARLQRRAEEMEAQRQEAAAEAATMPDPKAQELASMQNKISSMSLVEHDVGPFVSAVPTPSADLCLDQRRWSLPIFSIC